MARSSETRWISKCSSSLAGHWKRVEPTSPAWLATGMCYRKNCAYQIDRKRWFRPSSALREVNASNLKMRSRRAERYDFMSLPWVIASDTLIVNQHAHFLELGVIRIFDFVSALRRMSVVVKRLKSSSMEIYVKGAPEVMQDICDPDTCKYDFPEVNITSLAKLLSCLFSP